MGACVIKLRQCSHECTRPCPFRWRVIMRFVVRTYYVWQNIKGFVPPQIDFTPKSKDNCSFIVSKVIGEQAAICVAEPFSKSSLSFTKRNCVHEFHEGKKSITAKIVLCAWQYFFRQFIAMNEINAIRVIEHHDLQLIGPFFKCAASSSTTPMDFKSQVNFPIGGKKVGPTDVSDFVAWFASNYFMGTAMLSDLSTKGVDDQLEPKIFFSLVKKRSKRKKRKYF